LVTVWMTTVAVDRKHKVSVVVVLNGLALLVENEDLVDTAVVSVDSMPVDLCYILSLWHLINEIERSIDIESK